jgi:hypothetical protein
MPHPTGWLETHGQQEDDLPDDCNICHTDRSRCQACHHDQVKRAELLEENCTPCHDQMSFRPATQIRHKGYAEHAVHFDVVEVKGEPYKCYDCHFEFGTSQAARAAEQASAHDLRLCWECHGNLDYEKVLIAPYKGRELCERCHEGLAF